MTILYNIVYALLSLCLDAANFLLIMIFPIEQKNFGFCVKSRKIVDFLHSQFNFSMFTPEVFYNFPQILPLVWAFTKVLYVTFLITITIENLPIRGCF